MRKLAIAALVLVASAGPVLAQASKPAKTAPPAKRAAAVKPASKNTGKGTVTPIGRALTVDPLLAIPSGPTLDEQEAFLRTAKIAKTKGAKKGVTGTQRATMSDGVITHDASIQMVDQEIGRFETNRGVELNFRDYWAFNVAAYRLGRMLDLDRIPPSVERRHQGKRAAFTWWVDDVLMDEEARVEKKTQPPDSKYFHAQNDIVRIFDALIGNVDRNQGNLLIDKDWKIWMIDHTRAFRTFDEPKSPERVVRCERNLFGRLKLLTEDGLKAQLDEYLSPFQIRALLKRRDWIVARIESRGPDAIYEMPTPAPPPVGTTK